MNARHLALLAVLLLAAAAALPAAAAQVTSGASPTASGNAAPTATPAAAAPSVASPVKVTARAAKDEVSVGEVFLVEVKASGPAGTSYEFPPELSGDSFDLRTPPPPAGAEPSPLPPGTHRYQAAVFTVADAAVPAIRVRFHLPDGTVGEAASEPIALRIVSLLPKSPQEQKLADIREPLAVSIGAAFWIALALVVILVCGLVAFWLRRRRRPQQVATAPLPVVPPDMEAQRELDLLAASGLLQQGEHRAFYIRLTVIAKRYLERRLLAPILEMTTSETLAFLRAHPFAGELLGVVRDISEAADRIKFARGEGLTEEAERHLAAVRTLVRTVEAKLAPREPAKEEAA